MYTVLNDKYLLLLYPIDFSFTVFYILYIEYLELLFCLDASGSLPSTAV